jgi:hypothetical protein
MRLLIISFYFLLQLARSQNYKLNVLTFNIKAIIIHTKIK